MSNIVHPIFLAAALSACSASTQQQAAHAAECAAVEEFYDTARSEIIARGACDHVERVEQCAPYVVLEELYVESVKTRRCP